MAQQETYVDRSLAASPQVGAGTIGDPYSSIEHALRSLTRDATNGDRINIKAGTGPVIESNLADIAVTELGWTMTHAATLVFQGYTAAAGDGGKADIDCDGDSLWDDSSADGLMFIDLIVHNCGTNRAVNGDDNIFYGFCEFHDCGGVDGDFGHMAYQCYFHDCTGGMGGGNSSHVDECYFLLDDAAVTAAFAMGSTRGTWAIRNIVVVRATAVSATSGIAAHTNRGHIQNNSVYIEGLAISGINFGGTGVTYAVLNNLVEGASGVGGIGIDFNAQTGPCYMYQGNSIYDCETAENGSTPTQMNEAGNETLTASPFTDAAGDDFSPADVGLVKEGSLPQTIGHAYA